MPDTRTKQLLYIKVLLRDQTRILGIADDQTIFTRWICASVLLITGHVNEALLEMQKLALDTQVSEGAPTVPAFRVFKMQYISALIMVGRSAEAQSELTKVMAEEVVSSGEDSGLAFSAREQYAVAPFRLGRNEEAQSELRTLVSDESEYFAGDESVYPIRARMWLLILEQETGNPIDELELERVIDALSGFQGSRSPDVIALKARLAYARGKRMTDPNGLAEAIVDLQSRIEQLRTELGPDALVLLNIELFSHNCSLVKVPRTRRWSKLSG